MVPYDLCMASVEPIRKPSAEAALGVLYATLDDLLATADYVVLTLPLTPDTRCLIEARALRVLPQGAIVINIGRGGIVDEEALISALSDRHLGGAILDTFPVTPLPENSPLWDMPGVSITPHMAGGVYADELARACVRNLLEFCSGAIPAPRREIQEDIVVQGVVDAHGPRGRGKIREGGKRRGAIGSGLARLAGRLGIVRGSNRETGGE